MKIVFNRVVTVPLPTGTYKGIRAIQTEIKESFSSKEHFIDWYNDNFEDKINIERKDKFVIAPKRGETIYRFYTLNNNAVDYTVLSEI